MTTGRINQVTILNLGLQKAIKLVTTARKARDAPRISYKEEELGSHSKIKCRGKFITVIILLEYPIAPTEFLKKQSTIELFWLKAAIKL